MMGIFTVQSVEIAQAREKGTPSTGKLYPYFHPQPLDTSVGR
jgi:hypothetical protein